MMHENLTTSRDLKTSGNFRQCIILWRNLPDTFKNRWRTEARDLSLTGYNLFIKTNMRNLHSGAEIIISPWH